MERCSGPSLLLGHFRFIFRLPELGKDKAVEAGAPFLPIMGGILENKVLVGGRGIRSKGAMKLPVGRVT